MKTYIQRIAGSRTYLRMIVQNGLATISRVFADGREEQVSIRCGAADGQVSQFIRRADA